MEIEFTVRIDPEKRRHECHAAIAFVTAATLLLVLIGLFWPPLWLCLMGAWIPLAITSFKRYGSMRRQERCPDKLQIKDDWLIYLSGGKPSFSLPLADICRIEGNEGLRIFTRRLQKISLLDPSFSVSTFLAESKKQRCDLFFAWFDELAKTRLQDVVHANQSHHLSPF